MPQYIVNTGYLDRVKEDPTRSLVWYIKRDHEDSSEAIYVDQRDEPSDMLMIDPQRLGVKDYNDFIRNGIWTILSRCELRKLWKGSVR